MSVFTDIWEHKVSFILHGPFDGNRVLMFKEKNSLTHLDLALS